MGRRLHSFLSLCPAVGSAHVCSRSAMRELDESARKLSCRLVVYELIQLALVFWHLWTKSTRAQAVDLSCVEPTIGLQS